DARLGVSLRRSRVPAFATLLCVAPAKNTARFSPKKTPGIHTRRMSRSATRRPVLHRTTFHTTLTVARRQNATSTPGVSARLTNVELSENATTRPRIASTPSVFALSARPHAGTRAACGTALIRAPNGGLSDGAEFDTRLLHRFGPAGDHTVEILGRQGKRIHVSASATTRGRAFWPPQMAYRHS